MALTSLSHIYRLIRTGGVRVNGKKRRQDYRLAENDVVEIESPAAELRSPCGGEDAPADLADTVFFKRHFKLLFEDENLLVCDKPPNIVVHSGTGHEKHDSLIDLAAAYCAAAAARIGGERAEPLLVHRLDRDTSGVLLIAKNRRTLRMLHGSLREGAIKKDYIALCHGCPVPADGVIEACLVRDFDGRDGTKVRVEAGGQRAVSVYRVIDVRGEMSRVEIALQTGRTHQIRVHMAHIGCPVAGDVRYGDRRRDERLFGGANGRLRRLYLHAHRISFFYPAMKRVVDFVSPAPEQFDALWRTLSPSAGIR